MIISNKKGYDGMYFFIGMLLGAVLVAVGLWYFNGISFLPRAAKAAVQTVQ